MKLKQIKSKYSLFIINILFWTYSVSTYADNLYKCNWNETIVLPVTLFTLCQIILYWGFPNVTIYMIGPVTRTSLFRYKNVGCHPGLPPSRDWEWNRSGIWNLWNAFSDAAITTCIQSPQIPHIHRVMGSGNVLAAFYRSRVAAGVVDIILVTVIMMRHWRSKSVPSSGQRLSFFWRPALIDLHKSRLLRSSANDGAVSAGMSFIIIVHNESTCEIAVNSFN